MNRLRQYPKLLLLAATLAAALTTLGGCAQTAHREATAVSTPSAWVTADPAIRSTDTAPETLTRWWTQFNDPVLDALIGEALQSAPDVRTASAKLRQARAGLDLAEANRLPSVGASASAKRSKSGTADAQTLYSAGFDASWEPPIFNGANDAVDAAQADAQAVALAGSGHAFPYPAFV